ncbi:MAG: polysaccharide deacetylase family protein [Candidatus Omnitrophica bacterium]|nr:polysaccharide deacetylase family protein [Candidatus Omnitrophota bacterium]
MKAFLKRCFSLLVLLDALSILRFFYRKRVIILFYHGVCRDVSREPDHADGRHVRLEKFRRQMAYIARKYTPVTLDQAVRSLRGAGSLPPNPLVVTFDDGYRNNLSDMYPVASGLGIPVTIFVSSILPPDDERARRFLSGREVKELKQKGVSFGSHSASHAHLARLPDAELDKELSGSRRTLEELLMSPVEFLSYPWGENDERVRARAKAAGYKAACTVDYGVNGARSDLFSLKRIAVNDNYSFEYFVAALLPGLFSLVRRVFS